MKTGLKILSIILFIGEVVSSLGTLYQPIADAWERHKKRCPDPVVVATEEVNNNDYSTTSTTSNNVEEAHIIR